MTTAEGAFPKVAGDPFFSSEYNLLWKNNYAQVATTHLTCDEGTGYIYWSAGTITLYGTAYTLSLGNSAADWRGKYIIATLSGAAATLSATSTITDFITTGVLPIAFIDSNGKITHFFSTTNAQEFLSHEAPFLYGDSGDVTKTYTVQQGQFAATDAVVVDVMIETNFTSATTIQITLNDGSGHAFTAYSQSTANLFLLKAISMNGYQNAVVVGTHCYSATPATTAIDMRKLVSIAVRVTTSYQQYNFLYCRGITVRQSRLGAI